MSQRTPSSTGITAFTQGDSGGSESGSLVLTAAPAAKRGCGRPRLNLSEEERLERKREQDRRSQAKRKARIKTQQTATVAAHAAALTELEAARAEREHLAQQGSALHLLLEGKDEAIVVLQQAAPSNSNDSSAGVCQDPNDTVVRAAAELNRLGVVERAQRVCELVFADPAMARLQLEMKPTEAFGNRQKQLEPCAAAVAARMLPPDVMPAFTAAAQHPVLVAMICSRSWEGFVADWQDEGLLFKSVLAAHGAAGDDRILDRIKPVQCYMAVSLHLQLHHRLDVVRRLCALSVAPGQSEAEADAEMVQLVAALELDELQSAALCEYNRTFSQQLAELLAQHRPMVDLSQMGGSMQWLLQPTSLHSLSQQFLALSDVVGQLQALEGAMMRALADFYVCVVGVLSPLQRAKAMAHMWPRYPDFVRGVRLLSEGRTAAGKGLPAA